MKRIILSAILIPKQGIHGICYSVAVGWLLLTLFEGAYAIYCEKRISFPDAG